MERSWGQLGPVKSQLGADLKLTWNIFGHLGPYGAAKCPSGPRRCLKYCKLLKQIPMSFEFKKYMFHTWNDCHRNFCQLNNKEIYMTSWNWTAHALLIFQYLCGSGLNRPITSASEETLVQCKAVFFELGIYFFEFPPRLSANHLLLFAALASHSIGW